jgi:hypothetical protein
MKLQTSLLHHRPSLRTAAPLLHHGKFPKHLKHFSGDYFVIREVSETFKTVLWRLFCHPGSFRNI